MAYSIEVEERGIVKRFHGFLSGEEFEASAQPMGSSRAFDSARYIIIDFSRVEGHSIHKENLEYARALQDACKASNEQIRVALVVVDSGLAGMCREVISDSSLGGYDTQVFLSEKEARDWLGTTRGRHP